MDHYSDYHANSYHGMDTSIHDSRTPTTRPGTDQGSRKSKSSRRGAGTPRSSIACERCRKRKIRCSGDQGHGAMCTACSNANLDASSCIYNRVNCVNLVVVPDSAHSDLSSSTTNHLISQPGLDAYHQYDQENGYTTSGPATPMATGASGDYYSYPTAHQSGAYDYSGHGSSGSWAPAGTGQIQPSVPLVDRRLPTPIRSPMVGSAGALRADLSAHRGLHVGHWTTDPYSNMHRPTAMEQLANISSMMTPICTTSEAPPTLSPHYHHYPSPPFEDYPNCSAPTLPPLLTSAAPSYQALPPASQLSSYFDRSASHHQHEQPHSRYGWRPAVQMEID